MVRIISAPLVAEMAVWSWLVVVRPTVRTWRVDGSEAQRGIELSRFSNTSLGVHERDPLSEIRKSRDIAESDRLFTCSAELV